MGDYYVNDNVNIIQFTENEYSHSDVTGKVEKVGSTNYTITKGRDHTIIVDNGIIKKTVSVGNSRDYVYDIKKTQINAMGGVNGLMKFLAKDESFRLTIVHKIFDYMIGKEEYSKGA